MLIVASILMVSTSYAWFVMSTAPEVSGIKTQVGSNGALEIALFNTESWNDLSLLDMGDIDESVAGRSDNANLTWGNIVDLSGPSYGLDQIVLNPSRLNISLSGSDENGSIYNVGNILLKTPVYGEDGRIQSLDSSSALSYVFSGGSFSQEGYGVRAIGTSAGMGSLQLGMNTARNQISTYMAAARREASSALNSTGGKIANIVVQYAVNNKTTGYTDEDVGAVKELAAGLQSSLHQIEVALRYAFAGYITTENAIPDGLIDGADSMTSEELYQAAYGIIFDDTPLSTLMTDFPGITSLVPDMSVYISQLESDQSKVDSAIETCDSYSGGSYSWAQIEAVSTPLVDSGAMMLGGKSIDELKSELRNPDGSVNFGAAFELISGGIVITVPTGSGILSDISDFAGDYASSVTVEQFKYGDYGPMDMGATMQTQTTMNPVYLVACSNGLRSGTVAESSGSSQITDFYGYAIDLAFRTNAETSKLLLQTEGVQRIYDDSDRAATQGGGSYMTFSTNSGLSVTKMIKMMQGIRVVFIDDSQKVLAVASLDCKLGKDAYAILDDEHKIETGMYAYLNAYPENADGTPNYQISDLIDDREYDNLDDESSLTIEVGETTSVSAKLYTRYFEMTQSTAEHETEGTYYTGGLTLLGANDQVITPLQQDIVKRVTAIVYLDGSFVTNAMVAADSTTSMTGVLNLQFSSSATLLPAEISSLRNGDPESDENDSTQNNNGEEPGDVQQGDNGGNG